MNGNTEAVPARRIDPICASPLASTWGTLRVQIEAGRRAVILMLSTLATVLQS